MLAMLRLVADRCAVLACHLHEDGQILQRVAFEKGVAQFGEGGQRCQIRDLVVPQTQQADPLEIFDRPEIGDLVVVEVERLQLGER